MHGVYTRQNENTDDRAAWVLTCALVFRVLFFAQAPSCASANWRPCLMKNSKTPTSAASSICGARSGDDDIHDTHSREVWFFISRFFLNCFSIDETMPRVISTPGASDPCDHKWWA